MSKIQVRVLLKELEEARGTMVHLSAVPEARPVGDQSSSAQLISQKLVTFK